MVYFPMVDACACSFLLVLLPFGFDQTILCMLNALNQSVASLMIIFTFKSTRPSSVLSFVFVEIKLALLTGISIWFGSFEDVSS